MAFDAPARLDQISTRWELVRDPVRFVMRYAPAIQRFLGVLIKHPQDAEEVSQEFLAGVLERGLPPQEDVHGRFRNYLIVAVRNAARMHFRRRLLPTCDPVKLEQVPAIEQGDAALEREWLSSWRQCLLDRVWDALERYQQKTPGSLACTVLRLSLEYPGADSDERAKHLSTQIGRPLGSAAWRKQLSRARRRFASLLVAEVARTLAIPTPLAIREELGDLGLLCFVRDFLPDM